VPRAVEEDQASEAAEAVRGSSHLRPLPRLLNGEDESGHEHQVTSALTDGLVGDMDAVRSRRYRGLGDSTGPILGLYSLALQWGHHRLGIGHSDFPAAGSSTKRPRRAHRPTQPLERLTALAAGNRPLRMSAHPGATA
jgi:hypothetical protein